MNKNNHLLAFNKTFIVVLVIYLIGCIYQFNYYRLEGLNANSIGFISVALEYARGNFDKAINGFWPPLISWSMLPFMKFGLTPLLAGRVVMLITGLFLIVGVRALSYKFELNERTRSAILFAMIPITLSYTKNIMPDLLILCFLVYYLNIIFKSDYSDSIFNGASSGVVGAFAYFGKNYAFPFFVSHFLLFNAFHYFRSTTKVQKKNVLRNALVGLVIFSFISGIWIVLISSKYDRLNIGTAGKYNFAIVKYKNEVITNSIPDFEEGQAWDPVYFAGLLKPNYGTALSVWDDPTYVVDKYYKDAKLWIGGTSQALTYHLRVITEVSKRIIKISIKFFSILTIPILIAYILFSVQPIKKLILQGHILYPFATMLLYSAGYTVALPFLDDIRYYWLDNILLLLMGGQVLSILFRSNFFNNTRKNILILIFVLSFIAVPLKDIMQKSTRGEDNYSLYKQLETHYNIQGNIASNDRWGDTLQLVYYLNLNNDSSDNRTYYYGMPKMNQDDENLIKELKTHDIDYYLVWGESGFQHSYSDITKGKTSGLRIYSLKE